MKRPPAVDWQRLLGDLAYLLGDEVVTPPEPARQGPTRRPALSACIARARFVAPGWPV